MYRLSVSIIIYVPYSTIVMVKTRVFNKGPSTYWISHKAKHSKILSEISSFYLESKLYYGPNR